MPLETTAGELAGVGGSFSTVRALRTVFCFPVMLAMSLLVLVVLSLQSRFSDPDLWWHLKTGEIIWNTHSIPSIDLFSFTTHNHPYTPHEWLAQLTIYGAWKFGTYTGLMLWSSVFPYLFVLSSYALCSIYSGDVKIAFLGTLITWGCSILGLSIRPQVIGFLMLSCELLIVQLGRSRDRRWFWALPPLFALWVNCHGSFLLGIVMLASFLLCSFVDLREGLLVCRAWKKQTRNALAGASVLSIAALFANPIGLQQVLYPLNVLLKQHHNLANVIEWQPLSFGDIRSFLLVAVAGLILLVPLLRRIDLYLEEILLVVIGAAFAARHSRMLIAFGIVAAPILCRLLANTLGKYESSRDHPVSNAILLILSAAVVVLAFPSAGETKRLAEAQNPVKAIEFLERSGLSGRMLNEYSYGGYLIWAAPEHKVFVDGRTDIYEWTGVLDDYLKWIHLEAAPHILLDKYQIDFCLLPRGLPITQVLPLLPRWRKIYSDESSVIFSRNGPPPL